MDGVAKRLVMDRVFFRDSWWIVDYKTAEPNPNQAVADFVSQEVSRYRGQLDQYSSALSSCSVTDPSVLKVQQVYITNKDSALLYWVAPTRDATHTA